MKNLKVLETVWFVSGLIATASGEDQPTPIRLNQIVREIGVKPPFSLYSFAATIIAAGEILAVVQLGDLIVANL